MPASPPPIDRARDLSDVAAGTPAKGDLLANNGTAYAKVAVGSDTQVLTADSGQASGVKWATPAAAPVTSVAGRTGIVVLTAADVGLSAVLNAKQVTSIALATPSVVYASPINFSVDASGNATGTLTLNTQAANIVFAGPASGSAATPTMRAIVVADLPTTTGGTGTELQYRSTANTTSAVTGSSVDGSGNVTLPNSVSLLCKDTGGTARRVFFLDSANNYGARNEGTAGNAVYGLSNGSNSGGAILLQLAGNNRVKISPANDLISVFDASGNTLVKLDLNANPTTYGGNVTLSNLSVPTGLSVTPQGTTGATSYGYAVTAVNAQGETVASSTVTTATGNATLTSGNKNHLAFNASNGATSYNLYRISGGATQGKIGSVTGTGATAYTFDDTGLAASGAAPTAPTGTTFVTQKWRNQTADIHQWQDETGAALASVDKLGQLSSPRFGLPNLPVSVSGTGLALNNATYVNWTTGGFNSVAGGTADVSIYRSGAGTLSTGGGAASGTGHFRISGNVGFYNTTPAAQQTVTGSKGANAALASLLTALAATGLIVDSSS